MTIAFLQYKSTSKEAAENVADGEPAHIRVQIFVICLTEFVTKAEVANADDNREGDRDAQDSTKADV